MSIDNVIQSLHEQGPRLKLDALILETVLMDCIAVLSNNDYVNMKKALHCMEGLALVHLGCKEWLTHHFDWLMTNLKRTEISIAIIDTVEAILVDCSKAMRIFERDWLEMTCVTVRDKQLPTSVRQKLIELLCVYLSPEDKKQSEHQTRAFKQHLLEKYLTESVVTQLLNLMQGTCTVDQVSMSPVKGRVSPGDAEGLVSKVRGKDTLGRHHHAHLSE